MGNRGKRAKLQRKLSIVYDCESMSWVVHQKLQICNHRLPLLFCVSIFSIILGRAIRARVKSCYAYNITV